MTNNTQNKGVNPIAVALGGVVAGVGLAVAGAMAMKDKEVAKNVEKGAKDFKEKSEKVGEKISQKVDSSKKDLKNMVSRGQDTVEKIKKDIKES